MIFPDQVCLAIQKRVAIQLRYKDDLQFRTFNPHAVYQSTKDKTCVSGTQTQNPNEFPPPDPAPRNFDLDDIREMRLTDVRFTPDPRFDRTDPRYKNGIICSV